MVKVNCVVKFNSNSGKVKLGVVTKINNGIYEVDDLDNNFECIIAADIEETYHKEQRVW